MSFLKSFLNRPLSVFFSNSDVKKGIRAARPYKAYVALLTQTSTGAPTATVLDNTIGAIVWTRTSAGLYVGTLTGAFTANKTTLDITYHGVNGAAVSFGGARTGNNTVSIGTGTGGTLTDALLTATRIEIRVYE